jgi:hypothetical protein
MICTFGHSVQKYICWVRVQGVRKPAKTLYDLWFGIYMVKGSVSAIRGLQESGNANEAVVIKLLSVVGS